MEGCGSGASDAPTNVSADLASAISTATAVLEIVIEVREKEMQFSLHPKRSVKRLLRSSQSRY